MVELPEGVITFLLTDVQGSTPAWERSPDAMLAALRQHDEAIEGAVAAHGGVTIRPRGEGDSTFNVFASAVDAIAGAAEMQRRLHAVEWATPTPLLVRAGIHTGVAELYDGDYYGTTVNRTARVRSIAHGGQTLLSRATWELVRDDVPDGVRCRDMGEQRLKDLTRPEHVYQLDVDGLPTDFPPLDSLDAVPNNLPAQPTDLIGRESELAEVAGLLAEHRLVTILAPGGTGKTRLALQAGAEATGSNPDGVFLVPLADLRTGDDMVQAVAEALGLGLSSADDVHSQLKDYLATKRLLLVFDNAEHIGEVNRFVSELLAAANDVRVLVTSRSRLNLSSEAVYALGGLDISWDDPSEARQTEGVRLFVDTARRVRRDFTVEEADLEAMQSILTLTGGVPLAIILAAAWVDVLSVTEIADEIGKSLDFLESERADVPDRHRSVRAVFDYSWALLSDEERDVFSALSVFRGGFTRAAADTVAGASIRQLASLSAKSLLTADPDTGRYALHTLLREYAEEALRQSPERCDAVIGAHAAYYTAVMNEARDLLRRGKQGDMAALIEPDLDNVRYAWRHAIAVGDLHAVGRFVPALQHFYELRGWNTAGVALFDGALAAIDPSAEDATSLRARALVAVARGWFITLLGQPEQGAAIAESATALLREHGDTFEVAIALQTWAMSLLDLGAPEETMHLADQGIALAKEAGDPLLEAEMQQWQAAGRLLSGDFEGARGRLEESIGVLEASGDMYGTVWNLTLQAWLALQEERFDDALDLFRRQHDNARAVGYSRAEMTALEGIGLAAFAAGHVVEAEDAHIRSLARAEQLSLRREMLTSAVEIARCWSVRDRQGDAVELLVAVLADPVSALNPSGFPETIRDRAEEVLDTLREAMAPEDFEAAEARSGAAPFDVRADDIIRQARQRTAAFAHL